MLNKNLIFHHLQLEKQLHCINHLSPRLNVFAQNKIRPADRASFFLKRPLQIDGRVIVIINKRFKKCPFRCYTSQWLHFTVSSTKKDKDLFFERNCIFFFKKCTFQKCPFVNFENICWHLFCAVNCNIIHILPTAMIYFRGCYEGGHYNYTSKKEITKKYCLNIVQFLKSTP